MSSKSRSLVFLVAAALLFPVGASMAQSMTWLEHREAAAAQLGYQLADPVTPVQHLEKALELARAQKASPADIGDLMDRLARAYATEDNAAVRQEALLEKALTYKERHLGKNAPELVPTLTQLSEIRFAQQRRLESLQLMARALTIRVQSYGPQSAEAAEGYTMLGTSFLAVGEKEQAETLLRRAVETVRAVPDPPDDTFTLALANLSWFLRERGDREEAEVLQREMSAAVARQGKKAAEEARHFEHLPRTPSPPDVVLLSDREVAAAVAAGLATVDPNPAAL